MSKNEHQIASSTLYSATCTCGHVERSTIRFAAVEVYMKGHIDMEAEAAESRCTATAGCIKLRKHDSKCTVLA